MASLWVSCMSDDDSVERFSERSDARERLFRCAPSRLNATQLSSPIWAFLQVGDLETVRDLTRSKGAWEAVYLSDDENGLALNEHRAKDAICLWAQRKKGDAAVGDAAAKDAAASKRSHSIAFPSTPAPPTPAHDVNQATEEDRAKSALPRTRSGQAWGGGLSLV
jgi:hypothetical protein